MDIVKIHRLVQSVVRDDMSPEKEAAICNQLVEYALAGFPNSEDLHLCRRYRHSSADFDGVLWEIP